MAIGTAAAIGAGIASAAGAVAGAIPKGGSSGPGNMGQPGQLEQQGINVQNDTLKQLQELLSKGASIDDVAKFTNQLRQARETGLVPQQADIQQANQYAAGIYAPQQAALQQSFQEQRLMANQQAARMGRDINDPTLQGTFGVGLAKQQQQLNAQQFGFGTQTAMDIAKSKLGFGEMLSNQASQNRQLLFGLGNTIANQGFQQRLAMSGQQQSQGGGFGGFLEGGLAGFGAAAKMYNPNSLLTPRIGQQFSDPQLDAPYQQQPNHGGNDINSFWNKILGKA